jgi:hypothetical protein
MRARTIGRWVARAVFVAALGVGVAIPVAASAGESGVGNAVAAAVAKPAGGVSITLDYEWA